MAMKRLRVCAQCKTEEYTFSKSEVCATCVLENKRSEQLAFEKRTLESYGYKVISGPTVDAHNHRKWKVITPCCGQEYEPLFISVQAMMDRRGRPPCNHCGGKERMSKALDAYVERYGVNYDPRAFKDYTSIVRKVSEISYASWRHLINPEGVTRGQHDWHLDHKVPISWCFKNGISPYHVGLFTNLQMLLGAENISKHDKVPENVNDILYGNVLNVLSYHTPVFQVGRLNLWPHDLHKTEVVNSMLAYRLGFTRKLNARDLEIKEVPKSMAKLFLDKNHLAGVAGCSYALGLFESNQLVMLVTLGKPRFSSKADLEVVRLAVASGTSIRGGASKLFSFIKKELNCSILTYSDKLVGSGAVYKLSGFELDGETGPGYFWERRGEILSRYESQKHKLATMENFDPSKSESVIMEEAGWRKVLTPGNLRWIL